MRNTPCDNSVRKRSEWPPKASAWRPSTRNEFVRSQRFSTKTSLEGADDSGLVGLIYRVRDNLSLDVAIRHALTNARNPSGLDLLYSAASTFGGIATRDSGDTAGPFRQLPSGANCEP